MINQINGGLLTCLIAGRAVKEYRRLPQTFLFLIGYFFLSDAVASMNSVVGILTISITKYDGLLQTYMNLINAACSIIGCFGFLYVQKHFQMSTKTMLQLSTGLSTVAALWGCVGIGSKMFGFRTEVELWIYNAWVKVYSLTHMTSHLHSSIGSLDCLLPPFTHIRKPSCESLFSLSVI